MSAEQLVDLLYRRSGMPGRSGISADFRDLLASTDPRAGFAVAVFCCRVAGHIGALAAALGGLDGIVFTAGVGENAAAVLSAICRACAWLGLALDDAANGGHRPHHDSSEPPRRRRNQDRRKPDDRPPCRGIGGELKPAARREKMSETRSAAHPAPGIFSAADIKRRMAEREAQKAAEELRHMKEQEEKQKVVMAEFHQPPARTPERLMQLVMQLVTQAAERGQTEIQVYRFPNSLCSDGGRRINNSLPEWEKTLDGRPKLGYEFWHDHLRPLGFGLKAEILEYPGGKPGDVGFFLIWK